MKKEKKAFTLAELLISIVILAILWTIGFMAYTSYHKMTRNVVRETDINTVKKALEYYYIKTQRYPNPDNYVNIYHNDIILWKQGELGENVVRELNSLNKVPLDPLYITQYTYSVTHDNKKYQIWYVEEQ